ncbi:uncharacterized protein A4U43_C02F22840 [Asparagus officinalis]|uniref:RRM domain-containing protein n=1 Tax=Asparagus officinalis TaxID=4686 RepID=A0A5P1FN24_ASPOF|nr:uncharacterized protein A4U43_C02F22840 [Asparagus officinalis]
MAATNVEFRCFIRGLTWATDSHSLEKAFSTYGEVIDSKIIVTFGSDQAMKDAIEVMNGYFDEEAVFYALS